MKTTRIEIHDPDLMLTEWPCGLFGVERFDPASDADETDNFALVAQVTSRPAAEAAIRLLLSP